MYFPIFIHETIVRVIAFHEKCFCSRRLLNFRCMVFHYLSILSWDEILHVAADSMF